MRRRCQLEDSERVLLLPTSRADLNRAMPVAGLDPPPHGRGAPPQVQACPTAEQRRCTGLQLRLLLFGPQFSWLEVLGHPRIEQFRRELNELPPF